MAATSRLDSLAALCVIAQKAKTNGLPVNRIHSSAKSQVLYCERSTFSAGSPMRRAASCAESMVSRSGGREVNSRPPPQHFSNKTRVSATEVREELSSATVLIASSGLRLTSRMERTAFLDAMQTPGRIERLRIVAYAAEGMMPISAVPRSNSAAHCEGKV